MFVNIQCLIVCRAVIHGCQAEEFVRRAEAEARANRPAAGGMSDIEAMLASRGAAAGFGACGWTQNNKDDHDGCR